VSDSSLEAEVRALRAQLDVLAERVRLDAVAARFVAADNHEIRSGDCVRFSDGHAAHVRIAEHSGKWTYTDRHGHCIEPDRVPPEEGIERLYTIAEVGEIVAKAFDVAEMEKRARSLGQCRWTMNPRGMIGGLCCLLKEGHTGPHQITAHDPEGVDEERWPAGTWEFEKP